jgi:hypothetical protein
MGGGAQPTAIGGGCEIGGSTYTLTTGGGGAGTYTTGAGSTTLTRGGVTSATQPANNATASTQMNRIDPPTFIQSTVARYRVRSPGAPRSVLISP